MQAPADLTMENIRDEIDSTLEFLQIENSRDTVVGDATLKGISGGQKRRVSFGVETVAGFSVLLADLPTNGLDSVTAHE